MKDNYIYFTREGSKIFFIATKLIKEASYQIIDNLYPGDDSENYIVSFRPDQEELYCLIATLLYGVIYESCHIKFFVYGFDVFHLFRFCNEQESRRHYFYDEVSPQRRMAFDNAILRLMQYYQVDSKFDLSSFIKRDILEKYQIKESYHSFAPHPRIMKEIYKPKLKQFEQELIIKNEMPSKWKSEQDMFRVIKIQFPDAIIHYTDDWLLPQHLDVYVPSIKCGFEYQGVQHFKSIEYFGGEKSYQRRKHLDNIKRQKCIDNDVKLIAWHYSEPITKIVLLKKLEDFKVYPLSQNTI